VKKRLNIFLVSDATGTTAEAVITSVLVQFTGTQAHIRRFPFTRTIEQVEEVVREAPPKECMIVFTLVSNELRETLVRRSATKGVVAVDVIGPLMDLFSGILKHSPSRTPGIFRHESDEAYAVTEAIHYTLKHDDGQGLATLDKADLIILGVSRTGKTPTSIFLSCRKVKVANIPIVHGIPLQKEVVSSPVKKVGFRMNVDRLVELRARRVDKLPITAVPGYMGRDRIYEEVEYCEEVYRRLPGIRTIDVTNRSIEETSEWITRNVL